MLRAKIFVTRLFAARAAVDGWGQASAYQRGQILYRAGEMRRTARANWSGNARSTGASCGRVRNAKDGSDVDRLVHYAGWEDKYVAGLRQRESGVLRRTQVFTPEDRWSVVGRARPDEAIHRRAWCRSAHGDGVF